MDDLPSDASLPSQASLSDAGSEQMAQPVPGEMSDGGHVQEVDELPSEPDLTSDDDDSIAVKGLVPFKWSDQCCSSCCLAKFKNCELQLGEWWEHRSNLRNDDMSEILWRMLQESKKAGVMYQFLGVPCCQKSFMILCRVGRSKLYRLQKHLESGAIRPPRDLRHIREVVDSRTRQVAAAFFQQLWEEAGEPLADDIVSPVLNGQSESSLVHPCGSSDVCLCVLMSVGIAGWGLSSWGQSV